MKKEQFEELWRNSDLPERVQSRIVGEINLLMYCDSPKDLDADSLAVLRLLLDIRYLGIISPREYDDLYRFTKETAAVRLHQLDGTEEEL